MHTVHRCLRCSDDQSGLTDRLDSLFVPGCARQETKRMLRARTVIYPLLLLIVVSGLGYAISTKFAFDARLVRGKGLRLQTSTASTISNTFNLRLVNRTDKAQEYSLSIPTPGDVRLEVLDDSTTTLQPGKNCHGSHQHAFHAQPNAW